MHPGRLLAGADATLVAGLAGGRLAGGGWLAAGVEAWASWEPSVAEAGSRASWESSVVAAEAWTPPCGSTPVWKLGCRGTPALKIESVHFATPAAS